jgi:lipooligosaccharide transport system ATP-binding protein
VGSAVHATGLTKRYGALTAVDGIDLDVPIGTTFGVLGPNGAGKTTLMKMITCVSPPTAGHLEVLGVDVRGDRRSLKRRLGVVPQGVTLDFDLTVRENLVVHGGYHDLPRAVARDAAERLLDFAQLSERADAQIDELSGGMQRRLLIARALVNDPELVILDEPTTGLDPQARHVVWERLRNLRREGKTLLITTHYMDEATRLCDHLVVVDRGRIIAEGTPAGLIAAHVPPRVVEVHGTDASADEVRRVLGDRVRDVESTGDRVLAYGHDGAAIVDGLRDAGLHHQALLERDATLEDVFLRLTGHTLVD